jgi:hypothetical protein
VVAVAIRQIAQVSWGSQAATNCRTEWSSVFQDAVMWSTTESTLERRKQRGLRYGVLRLWSRLGAPCAANSDR